MITRVHAIKNLGSFLHFQGPPGQDCDFLEKTIIYADNATGKTTLSAVFKSYSSDDPVALSARATLGQDDVPFVKFTMNGKDRRFSESSWKGKEDNDPDILVFDHDYVERNVFSSEISSDHLKTIHRIVIGSEGRQLNEKLEGAKIAERDARKAMRTLDKSLAERNHAIGRNDYLALEASLSRETAEKNVEALKKRLSALREKSKVEALPIPQKQELKLRNFGSLKEALLLKRDIHSDAKQRVLQRISSKLPASANAEGFLDMGMKLLPSDETCPFCSQSLLPVSELLDDYRSFFDKSSDDQKKDLSERLAKFQKWSPENQIRKLMAEVQRAKTDREKWCTFIDGLPEFTDFNFEAEIGELNQLHQRCVDVFQKKEQVLDYIPELQDLNQLEDMLKSIADQLPAINEVVDTVVGSIDRFKKEIVSGDEADVRAELGTQEALLIAMGRDAVEWRKNYSSAKTRCGETEKERRECEAALDAYCESSYKAFEKGINGVLGEFGLKYTVNGLSPKSTNQSSEVSAAFSVRISGVPVSVSKRQESRPCFRNTLSEGEKNALGFAFFMTELRQTKNIENTIVVMDDPLSSFDTDRHESTAWLLAKLSNECRQLIVLSHRRDFVWQLCSHLEGDGRFLKLESLENKIKILKYDIKEDKQHEHEKHIRDLMAMADGGQIDQSKLPLLIRQIFEHALSAKYRRHTSKNQFGEILSDLEGKDLCPVIEDLKGLNRQTRDYCHAGSGQRAEMTVGEWRTLGNRALNTLDKI